MKRGSLRRSLSLRVGTGNQNADQSQASAAAPNHNNPQTTTTRQSNAGWKYDRELTARGGIHVNFGADLNRYVMARSARSSAQGYVRVGSGRGSQELEVVEGTFRIGIKRRFFPSPISTYRSLCCRVTFQCSSRQQQQHQQQQQLMTDSPLLRLPAPTNSMRDRSAKAKQEALACSFCFCVSTFEGRMFIVCCCVSCMVQHATKKKNAKIHEETLRPQRVREEMVLGCRCGV